MEVGDLSQIDKIQVLSFKENGDERGKLVVVEGLKDVPFEIKRLFYIYGSDAGIVRGCHANRRTEFVLVNVCGSSKVKIKDSQKEKVFVLDKPNVAIYLPNMTWKEMYDFSYDSVLLVLASELYDPNEYIRDLEDFVKEGERM